MMDVGHAHRLYDRPAEGMLTPLFLSVVAPLAGTMDRA